eukprot:3644637-Pyramimonas_sp.AAC.2
MCGGQAQRKLAITKQVVLLSLTFPTVPAFLRVTQTEEAEEEEEEGGVEPPAVLAGEFAWIEPNALCAFSHTDGREYPGLVVRVVTAAEGAAMALVAFARPTTVAQKMCPYELQGECRFGDRCADSGPPNVDVKGNRVAVKGNRVAVKGNFVAVKGNHVDAKGNHVAVKGNRVAVKGNSVDVKGNRVDVKGVLTRCNDSTHDLHLQPIDVALIAMWRACTYLTGAIRGPCWLHPTRPALRSITSFYGSSCANNGKDALNTPETLKHQHTPRATYSTVRVTCTRPAGEARRECEANSVDVKGNLVDVKGNGVAVKGNSVDVKGNSVAVKGNSGDVKGNSVAVKGNSVDVKGNSVAVQGNSVDVKGNHVAVKGNSVDVKGNSVAVGVRCRSSHGLCVPPVHLRRRHADVDAMWTALLAPGARVVAPTARGLWLPAEGSYAFSQAYAAAGAVQPAGGIFCRLMTNQSDAVSVGIFSWRTNRTQ